MGTLVEVHRQDGRPVLTKTATTAAALSRLTRETDRLRRAGHPGVVELIDVGEDPEFRITLAWAGVRTLETLHPPLPVAAALLASLAETVADLHALGIIHGRIDASHVIVDGEGRPRLCGFAGSDDPEVGAPDDVAALGLLMDLLIGAEAEPEPIPERRWTRRRWTGFARRSLQTLADQANHPEPEHRPTARQLARSIVETMPEARLAAPAAVEPDRLVVVADILDDGDQEDIQDPGVHGDVPDVDDDPILDEVPVDEDPCEEQDHAALNPVGEPEQVATRAATPLTFLGMRVVEGDHDTSEPGSDPFHAAGTEEAPPRQPEDPPNLRLDRPPRARRPGARLRRPLEGSSSVPMERVAKVVVMIVIVLLVAGMALRFNGANAPSPMAPMADGTTTTVGPGSSVFPASTTAGSTSPKFPSPRRSVCPPVTGTAVKLGDGCAQAVQVHDTAVQIGSARFRIGRPGDRVAVGDWDCDGQATPAIVRPATGEVFLFTSWAGEGNEVTVAPAAIVSGATAPIDRQPQRCGPLRVRRSNGSEATISSAGRRR